MKCVFSNFECFSLKLCLFLKMIKKLLVFLLTTIILVESLLPNAIGMTEAIKIGKLYEHFKQHQKFGEDFDKFFWEHYSSDSKHKSSSEHKNLPSFDSGFLAISFHVNYIRIDFVQNVFNDNFDQKVNITYSNTYRFDYLKTLLNPPQKG